MEIAILTLASFLSIFSKRKGRVQGNMDKKLQEKEIRKKNAIFDRTNTRQMFKNGLEKTPTSNLSTNEKSQNGIQIHTNITLRRGRSEFAWP